MIKFEIQSINNPNYRWLNINEGHINFDTGIRFVYEILDSENRRMEKNIFVINGDDFDKLGKSNQDLRFAILNHLLNSIESKLVI